MRYPWLDVRDIEAAAQGLLVKSLGRPRTAEPLIDLDAIVYDYLCEKERLSFTDEQDLGWDDGDQVLGRMKPIAEKIEITSALKQADEFGRYRFTLAHEIGHWVLHRPLFLAQADAFDLFGPPPEDAQLTSLNRSVFPDGSHIRTAPEEWQANRFAVELLIDPDVLRSEFVARFGAPVVAFQSSEWAHSRTLRDHARRLARYEMTGQASLCSVFGLSAEAMGIALQQRGYAVEQAPLI